MWKFFIEGLHKFLDGFGGDLDGGECPAVLAVLAAAVFAVLGVFLGVTASARLELSVRSLDREVRDLLQERITTLVTAQAQSLGVQAHIDYKRDYPVLVNTPAETELARQVGTELLGAERITRQGRPLTGSEDFAFMLEHCPGSYFMIGNGAGDGQAGHACMVHNPAYDFNDQNVAVGSAYWSLLVERFLPASL